MPTTMKALAASAAFALLWVATGYVAWGVYTRQHYLAAFEHTELGEPLSVVLGRFGPPSHIEPHYNVPGYDSGGKSACGESCWLRLWYELPFSLGVSPVTVDFNSQQVVIHKYQWSSP